MLVLGCIEWINVPLCEELHVLMPWFVTHFFLDFDWPLQDNGPLVTLISRPTCVRNRKVIGHLQPLKFLSRCRDASIAWRFDMPIDVGSSYNFRDWLSLVDWCHSSVYFFDLPSGKWSFLVGRIMILRCPMMDLGFWCWICNIGKDQWISCLKSRIFKKIYWQNKVIEKMTQKMGFKENSVGHAPIVADENAPMITWRP